MSFRAVPVIVAIVGCVLAVVMALRIRDSDLAMAQLQFERYATIIEGDLWHDFTFLEAELHRGRAFVSGRFEAISAAQWREFTEPLSTKSQEFTPLVMALIQRIPDQQKDTFEARMKKEIEGFGLSLKGKRDEHYIFTFVGPIPERAQIPYGQDIGDYPFRRATLERARDSGKTEMTPLVERAIQISSPSQSGIYTMERMIIYLAVYDRLTVPFDLNERRSLLKGWISVAFSPEYLFRIILQDVRTLNVRMFDTTDPGGEHEIYTLRTGAKELEKAGHAAPIFRKAISLILGGRHLLLDIYSSREFEDENVNRSSHITLGMFGIALSLMMSIIIHLLRDQHLAATALARSMTSTIFEQEAMLKEAQAIAHFGNWTYDIVKNISVCSEEALRILSIKSNENLTFEKFSTVIHPDDYKKVLDVWNDALSRRAGYDFEYRLMINSEIRWVHSTAQIRCNDNGMPIFAIGTLQDITERKKTQSQIDELVERITLATTTAGVGIWDQDLITEALISNEVQYRLYGVTPEEFCGTASDWRSRLYFEDQDRVGAEFVDAMTKGQSYSTEFRIVLPGGTIRTLKACIFIIRDANNRPIRAIGTNWDITDHCQAMADLREAKEHAQAANIAKGQFLATMSHELRTPLNAIIGFSDIMLAREVNESVRRHHGIVLKSAKNLLSLIQEILDFSKIDAGRITASPSDFRLVEKFDDIMISFSEEARQKGIVFNVNISENLPVMLRGDHGVLAQILVNLINNAFKFTKQGRVEVSAEPDEVLPDSEKTIIVFRVSDTGIGIRPENLHRIFDMFEREDNSLTAQFGGSGLGLAISKRLVELLGGSIEVESVPGIGSRFSFTAGFERPLEKEYWLEDEIVPELKSLDAGVYTILVVEDDECSRDLLSYLLSEAGYQVIPAGDGAAALRKLGEYPIDLILLDVRMPVMDGAIAVTTLRSGAVAGCRSDIPVIAITALAMPGDRERFLETGMTDYIAKPIDGKALLSKVRKLLITECAVKDRGNHI